jgi:signal peptidase II
MTRNKYYLVALLIVVIDHSTKWLASASLIESPIEIVPGYLRLSLVHNPGVAFGLFAGEGSAWKPYFFGVLAVFALAAIFLYSRHMPLQRHLLQWALAITTGGIFGNFLDRIVHGYVVDFIEFHIHDSFFWPNFNVADSCITIGIALLLIDTVRNPGLEEAAEPTEDGRI